MKTLIIGANGQLGIDLMKAYGGQDAVGLTHSDIEVSDASSVRAAIDAHAPDVIINTSAFHNVPECEKNPETAFGVNAIGVKNLADVSREKGIRLVHVSTDYVFDGRKKTPYTEADAPNPLNVYGVSKAAGEHFARRVKDHCIVRVASVFGVAGCRAKGGKNFVETMLALAKTRDTVQVTSNIICSPTYTLDAALRIRQMAGAPPSPGTYHVANSGECSWYEFALEIFRLSGLDIRVEKREEGEEIAGVARPLYSPLATERMKPMRHWKQALAAYIEERAAKAV